MVIVLANVRSGRCVLNTVTDEEMWCAGEGGIDAGELDFFLRGNTSLAKAQSEKPLEWISEKGWKDLLLLTSMLHDQSISAARHSLIFSCVLQP